MSYEQDLKKIAKHFGFEVTEEVRFHPVRRFRFDYAIEALKLGIEIDGGLWIKGGHSTPKGILSDREKDAEALGIGWRVLRIPTDWFQDDRALKYTYAVVERLADELKAN